MEEPKAKAWPKGVEGEFPNGPPTVVVTHRGCRLELRFAPGDFMGEGLVEEIRLLPDVKQLEPRVLRQFAPQAELYLAFARSAMRLLGPVGTPESRYDTWRSTAEALREISGPGRGLTDEFYVRIAENYRALIDGGEPYPIKALSEIHHVTISAASRWVKEARRRGLLPQQDKARA
jgi:hypothetical protein